MKQTRRLALVIALVAVAWLLPDRYSLTTFHDANSAGRVYAVHSYVEFGQWCFEDVLCRYGPRHDIVDVSIKDGRPCLQKAPGLSWLALAPYALMDAAGGRPPFHTAAWWLTFLCVTLPLLAAMWLFGRDLLARTTQRAALVATFTLMAASPLLVYSGFLMDYGLAIALLIAAMALLRDPGPLRSISAGLLLGFAVTVNYAFLFYGSVVAGVALWRRWREDGRRTMLRQTGWVALGGALPTAALLAYHDIVWGSPFSTAYDYLNPRDPVLAARMDNVGFNPGGLVAALVHPKLGMLFYAPWTAFGAWGLWRWLREPEQRWLAATGLGVLGATLAFMVVWVAAHPDDLAFNRHMLVAMPFLAAGSASFLEWSYGRDSRASAWLRGAFFGCVTIAVFYEIATAWSFPYHFGDVTSPIWQVSIPFFVSGIHVEALPLRFLSDNADQSWAFIALTSVALITACVVIARSAERPRRHVLWPALITFALLFAVGMVTSKPSKRSRVREEDAKAMVLESHWGISTWDDRGFQSNRWCHVPSVTP